MENNTETKKKRNKIWTALSGVATGLVNGFLGSGGGMIAVESLERNGLEQKKAHATSILAILPLSIASAVIYFLNGSVEFNTESFFLLGGAAIGGLLGALLLGKLSTKWVDWLFTILMIASGIRMFF